MQYYAIATETGGGEGGRGREGRQAESDARVSAHLFRNSCVYKIAILHAI